MTSQRTRTGPLNIRPAHPGELAAVGELTVQAYEIEGYLDNDHGYAETLRDAAARAAAGTVLVAVDDTDQLLGAVALFTRDAGPDFAEQAEPGDAVVRMLVTAPAARGRGVGSALAAACIERARELGCGRVRLSTQPAMTTAHRIYERLGFRRAPENDWEPVPGIELLGYELELGDSAVATPEFCTFCGRPATDGAHTTCQLGLEPPRYCAQCKRRMVVQVTPTGWTARCSEHGVTRSEG